MSEQVVSDPVKFARGRQSLEGNLSVASMSRLHDSLASDAGKVEFRLTGYLNEEGAPCMRCQVSGALKMICQRCLEPMSYALKVDSVLLLTTDETLLQNDDPEAPDVIMAQQDLPVADLVEEEILLVLPMAPLHAAGECKAVSALSETGKLHPFAALARLKSDKE